MHTGTTKVKDVLTTGEVAKICNVAPRTVSKWFDSGALHGYRIPGSKDRRIPLNQLIRFMKQHGMPLNGKMTEDDSKGVLGGGGFDGFLKKPFHVRQVLEAIEDATAVVY